MIRSISHQNITWLDITNPDRKDIQYLKDHFSFHEVVLDELTEPGHRPKVEHHDDYLFLILHFAALNKRTRIIFPRELEILITRTHIITAHASAILPLQIIFSNIETHPEVKNDYMQEGTGNLLFQIMQKIFENTLAKLDHIEKRINYIEEKIFLGEERKMVLEISIMKRKIIDFRRILAPQTTVIESLATEGEIFFGKKFAPHFADTRGTFGMIWNEIENHKETIYALDETNRALLSTKTGEIIKVLTVFSVIILPLSLIVNIWGMNVPLPLASRAVDFFIILGIMVITLAVMVAYFKKKHWL